MITQEPIKHKTDYHFAQVSIRSDVKAKLKVLAAHFDMSEAGLLRSVILMLWAKELDNITKNPRVVSNLTSRIIQHTPQDVLEKIIKDL